MRTFKDQKNRTWNVVVNTTVINRVRTMLKVDLLDEKGTAVFHRLASDPILLFDVLYVVCKPECDSQGISDESFGEGLAGDTIRDATNALLEELANFFPNRAQREALMEVIRTMNDVTEKGMDLLKERMKAKLPAAEEKAMAAVHSAIEKLFTDSPALSGSTPDR